MASGVGRDAAVLNLRSTSPTRPLPIRALARSHLDELVEMCGAPRAPAGVGDCRFAQGCGPERDAAVMDWELLLQRREAPGAGVVSPLLTPS